MIHSCSGPYQKKEKGRKSTTASASETREATANDTDALHKKRMNRSCGLLADTVRVLVVLVLSFLVTGLPWFLEGDAPAPPEFKFNLTERNICYWIGSTSILDPQNPCPYRGYISMDRDANNCLPWSQVMANETWMKALRAETEKQAGVVPGKFLEKVDHNGWKLYEMDAK